MRVAQRTLACKLILLLASCTVQNSNGIEKKINDAIKSGAQVINIGALVRGRIKAICPVNGNVILEELFRYELGQPGIPSQRTPYSMSKGLVLAVDDSIVLVTIRNSKVVVLNSDLYCRKNEAVFLERKSGEGRYWYEFTSENEGGSK